MLHWSNCWCNVDIICTQKTIKNNNFILTFKSIICSEFIHWNNYIMELKLKKCVFITMYGAIKTWTIII